MSSSGSSKYGERLVNVLGREEAHNEGELAAIKELEAIIQRDKPPPYIEYLMYPLNTILLESLGVPVSLKMRCM
jgi:hypothetical protein